MKVIIMGCGRVGTQLSKLMANSGHEVVVIDEDSSRFLALGNNFLGKTIVGVGFDRSILISAGIEQADAFAACSPSDNANIVSARIARNIFRVPRVVARLNDPRRAEIYRRLGLMTISMISWGSERIFELLTHPLMDPLFSFGRGEVSILTMEASSRLDGKMVNLMNIPGEISVISISRNGEAFIPLSGTEIQAGDQVFFAVQASAVERFESLFE